MTTTNDLIALEQIRSALPERMWSKVQIEDAADDDFDLCVVWLGAVNSSGYPEARFGKRMQSLHRVVVEDRDGPIPEGMQVDHVCGVKRCLRHTEVVTGAENRRRAALALASLASHPSSAGAAAPQARSARRMANTVGSDFAKTVNEALRAAGQ